jgi:hypothetical protein
VDVLGDLAEIAHVEPSAAGGAFHGVISRIFRGAVGIDPKLSSLRWCQIKPCLIRGAEEHDINPKQYCAHDDDRYQAEQKAQKSTMVRVIILRKLTRQWSPQG